MTCPDCGRRAHVLESIPTNNARRRRYECRCGTRFTTLEMRAEDIQQLRESARTYALTVERVRNAINHERVHALGGERG